MASIGSGGFFSRDFPHLGSSQVQNVFLAMALPWVIYQQQHGGKPIIQQLAGEPNKTSLPVLGVRCSAFRGRWTFFFRGRRPKRLGLATRGFASLFGGPDLKRRRECCAVPDVPALQFFRFDFGSKKVCFAFGFWFGFDFSGWALTPKGGVWATRQDRHLLPLFTLTVLLVSLGAEQLVPPVDMFSLFWFCCTAFPAFAE